MIVVLDTTETFSDLRLDGPNFRLLKSYLNRTRSRLAVPQIVYEETVNHFREQLSERIPVAGSTLREHWHGCLVRAMRYAPPSIDQAKAVEDFRRYLDMQIRELGGSVVVYGNVNLA